MTSSSTPTASKDKNAPKDAGKKDDSKPSTPTSKSAESPKEAKKEDPKKETTLKKDEPKKDEPKKEEGAKGATISKEEAKEAKEREAREAKEKVQREKEAKEKEKEDAKEAKEAKEREAKEAKEREAREARDAKLAKEKEKEREKKEKGKEKGKDKAGDEASPPAHDASNKRHSTGMMLDEGRSKAPKEHRFSMRMKPKEVGLAVGQRGQMSADITNNLTLSPEAAQIMTPLTEPKMIFRVPRKGKAHKRKFYLDLDKKQIIWKSGNKTADEAKVNISDIVEVRLGQTTEGHIRQKDPKLEDHSFSVIFGGTFETLDIICTSAKERDDWVYSLRYLIEQGSSDQLYTFLKQVWSRVDKKGGSKLTINEVVELLKSMNINVNKKRIQKEFDSVLLTFFLSSGNLPSHRPPTSPLIVV